MANAWRTEGMDSALQLVEKADSGESLIHVRWVWLNGPAEHEHRPRVNLQTLSSVHHEVVTNGATARKDMLYTYVPVDVPGARPGALELSESLDSLDAYTDTSAKMLIVMALILFVVGGILPASLDIGSLANLWRLSPSMHAGSDGETSRSSWFVMEMTELPSWGEP